MVLNNIAISFYFDKIIKQCSYYLGNVYLVNYPLLNDISTGHHQGKKIEIAAPICLLYLRTDGELVPIAIQLRIMKLMQFKFIHFQYYDSVIA